MVTEVAFCARQLRTTDWPRSMAKGSAVRVAVGASAAAGAGPRELGSTPLAFLWQPVMAPMVARAATSIKALRVTVCIALIEYLLLRCGSPKDPGYLQK